MEQFSIGARPGRREYSKEFKAELLAKCQEPGASIGGVAIAHGLHPNMLHRWMREARLARALSCRADAEPPAAFVPIPLAAVITPCGSEPPVTEAVQLRLQRGEVVVNLQCPLSQCGALLREILR
ncbi:IS66-like element accessory protein TnpA [Limnohabitans curvus]|nr:transposase [Limnohabitans curvus]